MYLFQANWHVDQRQYDAGDLRFRRALAKSAAGQERVVAIATRKQGLPRGEAQRNMIVDIPHSLLESCARKAEITQQSATEDHLKTNRSSLYSELRTRPSSGCTGVHFALPGPLVAVLTFRSQTPLTFVLYQHRGRLLRTLVFYYDFHVK